METSLGAFGIKSLILRQNDLSVFKRSWRLPCAVLIVFNLHWRAWPCVTVLFWISTHVFRVKPAQWAGSFKACRLIIWRSDFLITLISMPEYFFWLYDQCRCANGAWMYIEWLQHDLHFNILILIRLYVKWCMSFFLQWISGTPIRLNWRFRIRSNPDPASKGGCACTG